MARRRRARADHLTSADLHAAAKKAMDALFAALPMQYELNSDAH